jgi:hypothetical protein
MMVETMDDEKLANPPNTKNRSPKITLADDENLFSPFSLSILTAHNSDVTVS